LSEIKNVAKSIELRPSAEPNTFSAGRLNKTMKSAVNSSNRDTISKNSTHFLSEDDKVKQQEG